MFIVVVVMVKQGRGSKIMVVVL